MRVKDHGKVLALVHTVVTAGALSESPALDCLAGTGDSRRAQVLKFSRVFLFYERKGWISESQRFKSRIQYCAII